MMASNILHLSSPSGIGGRDQSGNQRSMSLESTKWQAVNGAKQPKQCSSLVDCVVPLTLRIPSISQAQCMHDPFSEHYGKRQATILDTGYREWVGVRVELHGAYEGPPEAADVVDGFDDERALVLVAQAWKVLVAQAFIGMKGSFEVLAPKVPMLTLPAKQDLVGPRPHPCALDMLLSLARCWRTLEAF